MSHFKLPFFIIKWSGYIFFTPTILNNDNLHFVQTWTDYFIFFISLAYSFITLKIEYDQQTIFQIRSNILSLGVSVLTKSTVINAFLSKLVNFFGARKAFKILNGLQFLDDKVWLFYFTHQQIKYKELNFQLRCLKFTPKTKNFNIFSGAVFFLNLIAFAVLQILTFFIFGSVFEQYNIKPFEGFLMATNLFLYQHNTISYVLITFAVYYRMKVMKLLIAKEEPQNLRSTRSSIRMKKLAIYLDKVCDLLEFVKICYSMNAVMSFLAMTFNLILCVYSIVSSAMRTDANFGDYSFMLMSIAWGIYYMPFLICMFVVPFLITKNGEEIEALISEILVKTEIHDKTAHKVFQILSLQLYHRRPRVEFGVFIIDWKLLLLGIGVCFTYVVIILQFELSSITNRN